jgi:hypothetical protein
MKLSYAKRHSGKNFDVLIPIRVTVCTNLMMDPTKRRCRVVSIPAFIREVPDSNLNPGTGYADSRFS